MSSINVTELRQHLPEYLKQAIARIVPESKESKREAALKRLDTLRGTVIVGDIISPIEEEWTADADHL